MKEHPMITEADLRGRYDEAQSAAQVRAALEAVDTRDGAAILRFLGHYVRWNAGFGAGVAHLAAKIGRAWEQFVDPEETIPAIADRSLHVASWFFDAARDEFDDSATPHRDAHRSLAQACLKGVIAHGGLSDEQARAALTPPEWLLALEQRTWRGYGLGTGDDRLDLAHAMGFHLGSEVLADEEFSLIDHHLRAERPDLVQALLRRKVEVAGAAHPAWYWIGVHSGHGGGVEEEHFAWAIRGVADALRYTPAEHTEAFREAVLDGFSAFAACHEAFFRHLSEG
jgi:hypothetical protein